MLPHPSLKPLYDKLVWVYVYRDFSGNEADRAAERILLRFGVSSWPQLFLADPRDWKILRHTGRKVESFLAAGNAVSVDVTRSRKPLERTTDAEKLARRLEGKPSVKMARAALDHDDVVVKTRAIGILAGKDPKSVSARASELLSVPNDPFRYKVCEILAETSDPKAAEALAALVRKPEPSLNPNVLRIRAVRALAACGDRDAVNVIAPFAQSGDYFNGLTGVAVDALAAIAESHKEARKSVAVELKKAYPPPNWKDARSERACIALARRIHKALGEKRSFPKVYDEAARAKLMR